MDHNKAPGEAVQQDLRVLSLDGGGVRGLSSLYILRALMKCVNDFRREDGQAAVKPCQLFDLIAGTSTGGLIAIMLGRLEMDVDDCIDVYRTMCKEVFRSPKSATRQGLSFAFSRTIPAKFSSADLESQILRVIEHSQRNTTHVSDPAKLLLEDVSAKAQCRVFVCATSMTNADVTTRLRSYPSGSIGEVTQLSIVQAALATSAATGFFDPVEIDGERFIDGALSANNPAPEVVEELKSIYSLNNAEFESRICCFVSIGTGDSGLNKFSDDAWEMIRKSLKNIVTETEGTAHRFEEAHKTMFRSGQAFRFNVIHGLQDVGLDEWNRDGEIKAKTRAYLSHPRRDNEFRQCAKQLADRVNAIGTVAFQMRRFVYALLSHWMMILTMIILPTLVWYYQTSAFTELIKQNAPAFQQQKLLDSNLPIYAVLGVTGVGKSSFIAALGGRHIISGEPPSIGHRLQSHTQECQFYRFTSFQTGDGYLIDTPGIDESNRTRTDTEIMYQIQNELEKVQVFDKMLMGLVFLYDIHQPRAYGSILNALDSTLDMVEYLLGTNGIAKITLVTTKWTRDASEATRKEEEERESMLRDDYWQGPIKCNSRLERYDGTRISALNIISSLKERRRPLHPGPNRCRNFTPEPEPEPEPEPSKPSTKGQAQTRKSAAQIRTPAAQKPKRKGQEQKDSVSQPSSWLPAGGLLLTTVSFVLVMSFFALLFQVHWTEIMGNETIGELALTFLVNLARYIGAFTVSFFVLVVVGTQMGFSDNTGGGLLFLLILLHFNWAVYRMGCFSSY